MVTPKEERQETFLKENWVSSKLKKKGLDWVIWKSHFQIYMYMYVFLPVEKFTGQGIDNWEYLEKHVKCCKSMQN